MKPKRIKIFWSMGLTLLLLLATAVALSMLWPRIFPSHYASDLYRRYEHNDFIRTTELHNFHVGDTLFVDVMMLEATTDSAWCALLSDFGVSKDLINRYKTDKQSFVGNRLSSITKFYMDKKDIKKRLPKDNPDSRLVVGSHAKKSLCIFIADEANEKDKISLIQLKNLKK